jgi:hypothetical protein
MRIGIRDLVHPGSGIRDRKSRIRDPGPGIWDEHPGSATVLCGPNVYKKLKFAIKLGFKLHI